MVLGREEVFDGDVDGGMVAVVRLIWMSVRVAMKVMDQHSPNTGVTGRSEISLCPSKGIQLNCFLPLDCCPSSLNTFCLNSLNIPEQKVTQVERLSPQSLRGQCRQICPVVVKVFKVECIHFERDITSFDARRVNFKRELQKRYPPILLRP